MLANAWDAGSARLVEQAGFHAVATSSWAVAASLGYADGEGAPAHEMLGAAARICRAVKLPVTVDAEAGYHLAPHELVARLVEMGAAGCNLEDTDHLAERLRGPAEQAAWLREVREAAGERLVLNARVDVFLHTDDEASELDEGLVRARAYLEAGADCVFPIHLRSTEIARRFIEALSPAAVNLTAMAGGPDLQGYAELGAARISFGGRIWHDQQDWLAARLARITSGATQ